MPYGSRNRTHLESLKRANKQRDEELNKRLNLTVSGAEKIGTVANIVKEFNDWEVVDLDQQDAAKEAEVKFKECKEAYEMLSDPDKRAAYDRFGHAGVDPSAGAAGAGAIARRHHAGGAGMKTFYLREIAHARSGDKGDTGNVGVMAAQMEEVRAKELPILFGLFAVIAVMCLLTFRSWIGAIVVMLPLALVSILAYTTMAIVGIGLKVTTLPMVSTRMPLMLGSLR